MNQMAANQCNCHTGPRPPPITTKYCSQSHYHCSAAKYCLSIPRYVSRDQSRVKQGPAHKLDKAALSTKYLGLIYPIPPLTFLLAVYLSQFDILSLTVGLPILV